MLPCIMESTITASVGRHLGRQPEALTKLHASLLVAETWGGKIETDGKKNGCRRLEIME